MALRASASPERHTVQDNTIACNDQGVVNNAGPYLDARRNYWGGERPSGATPQRLADPFAGLLLTGQGDSVPEGPIDGASSVRVAPVLTEPAPVRVPPGPSPGSGGPQFRYVEGAVDRRAGQLQVATTTTTTTTLNTTTTAPTTTTRGQPGFGTLLALLAVVAAALLAVRRR